MSLLGEGEEGEVEIREALEEEEEDLVEEEAGAEEEGEEGAEVVIHLHCRRGDLAKRFNLDSNHKHGGRQSDNRVE